MIKESFQGKIDCSVIHIYFFHSLTFFIFSISNLRANLKFQNFENRIEQLNFVKQLADSSIIESAALSTSFQEVC